VKWEYTFYTPRSEKVNPDARIATAYFDNKEMDKLGEDGWEAVGIWIADYRDTGTVLFKRPKK
jgi:hypothetical protein